MKKFLLTVAAALGFAATSNAQLGEATIFPFPGGATGHLTAVNGAFANHRYNLDSFSAAGYTIFVDVSATWCHPCWAYHSTHALDTLWAQHGPAGQPGVYPSTTNNVFVIFVQGEPTSHLAEFFQSAGSTVGSASVETPYSTASQGDWAAGSNIPMVDDTTSTDATYGTSALDALWSIAYFPTVYMVCRDRLVHVLTQPTAADAYAASLAECPSTPPSAGTDIKAISYYGSNEFICTASPVLRFQNYSATNTITSATVTVKDGTGATISTVPWTGSLAPYGIDSVTVPAISATSLGGYSYSVTTTGDAIASDNASADSIFKFYGAANAASVPYLETFGNGNNYFRYDFDPNGLGFPTAGTSSANIIGPSGSADTAYIFDDYDATNAYQASNVSLSLFFGNYNVTKANLSFDEYYSPLNGSTSTDSLQVFVSTDCGSTYQEVWSLGGNSTTNGLASTSGTASGTLPLPTAASQWKHIDIDLHPYASTDLLIALSSYTATTGKGECIFVDNLRLYNSTAVPQINLDENVKVYPNPARDEATVAITLDEQTEVTVELIDVLGRTISKTTQSLASGEQKVQLSTANVASGIYNVKISANGYNATKQLSVIK